MDLLGKLLMRILPRHWQANVASWAKKSPTRFSSDLRGGLIYADDGQSGIYFYNWKRAGRYSKKSVYTKLRRILDKYVPDWYELGADCTVIDIGANIGEFAMAIAPRVGKVIAIEPDERAYACLDANSRSLPRAIVGCNAAVGDVTGKKRIFISSDTADTSFIEPNKYTEKRLVQVYKLKDLLNKLDVDCNQIELIKIEAEGFEPEVLAGCLPHLKVKYYSVNCDPERYGESPIAMVRELLESNGYAVFENRFKLYAVLKHWM